MLCEWFPSKMKSNNFQSLSIVCRMISNLCTYQFVTSNIKFGDSSNLTRQLLQSLLGNLPLVRRISLPHSHDRPANANDHVLGVNKRGVMTNIS